MSANLRHRGCEIYVILCTKFNFFKKCEVLLLWGLPKAGKTEWARKYMLANPERKFNLLERKVFLSKNEVGEQT